MSWRQHWQETAPLRLPGNCSWTLDFANSEHKRKRAEMTSTVFMTMRMLEDARLHFFIERTRPDAIRFSVTTLGERIEIDVFEDKHLEISRFVGDESVEGDMDLLINILKSV
jgi:hypothetical protein